MKFKVRGLVFVGFAAAILSANAMAASDNTVTSKSYVDTHFQQKSTAASIGNSEGNWTALAGTVTNDSTTAPTSAAVKDYVDNAIDSVTGGATSTYQTKSTKNYQIGGQGGEWADLGDGFVQGTNISIAEGQDGKLTIGAPASGTVASGNTGLVSGGAVYDAIAAQATTDSTTYQAYSNAANRVSDGNGGWKALGTTLDTTDAGYDANNAVTAGTIAAALAENAEATTYTAGTNVQISADNEISATDTTYTAGSNITIDAANNNAIAATTGAVADNAATLVTGDAVYDYVQSQTNGQVLPMPTNCTATDPCALITDGTTGSPMWVPIAQAEAQVGAQVGA